jgi:hypothetical protein
MRGLKMPFVAGAAAVIALSAISGPRFFPRWDEQNQLIGGLVVGCLFAVVLYAVMRAIVERGRP